MSPNSLTLNFNFTNTVMLKFNITKVRTVGRSIYKMITRVMGLNIAYLPMLNNDSKKPVNT